MIMLTMHFWWAQKCWFAFAPSSFTTLSCNSIDYIDQKLDWMERERDLDIQFEGKKLIYQNSNYINYYTEMMEFFSACLSCVSEYSKYWISCSIISTLERNEMKRRNTIHCDIVRSNCCFNLWLTYFIFAFYLVLRSSNQSWTGYVHSIVCKTCAMHAYCVGSKSMYCSDMHWLWHPIRVTRDDDYTLDNHRFNAIHIRAYCNIQIKNKKWTKKKLFAHLK